MTDTIRCTSATRKALDGLKLTFASPVILLSRTTGNTSALSPIRTPTSKVSRRRLQPSTMCAASPSGTTEIPGPMSAPAVSLKDGRTECSTATLLVSCPDRKGIVAVVAQLLAGYGCNILSSEQFTDVVSDPPHYFQRVEFDYSALSVAPANVAILQRSIDELALQYEMKTRITFHGAPTRVAILVSKTDHCLYDLLLRFRSGELPRSEAAVVISNHPDLQHVAEHFGVPYEYFPIQGESGKASQEDRIEAALSRYGASCIVLARYMQIMSAEFCERHGNHMINIHHSFLPSFVGSRPYHQAHRHGVKLIGATAHFVSAVLDAGPIIHQSVTSVSHRDTPKDMVRKGRDLERITLALALRWFLLDRILVSGGRTVVFEE